VERGKIVKRLRVYGRDENNMNILAEVAENEERMVLRDITYKSRLTRVVVFC
jgi:hypothetical protein